MKQLTYDDVLKLVRDNYDSRNKRRVGKEAHIETLELSIKTKLKKLRKSQGGDVKNPVIDAVAFHTLYQFVQKSETETKAKAKRKNKQDTASSVTFESIKVLLEDSQQYSELMRDHSPHASGAASSIDITEPYYLSVINEMLMKAGIEVPEHWTKSLTWAIRRHADQVAHIHRVAEMADQWERFTSYLEILLPIVKVEALCIEGGRHSSLFITRFFAMSDHYSAYCNFLLTALAPCLEQTYRNDFDNVAHQKLEERQQWYRKNLSDLVDKNEPSIIQLINALNAADPKTLQAFSHRFADRKPEHINEIDYSLSALTEALKNNKMPDQPLADRPGLRR